MMSLFRRGGIPPDRYPIDTVLDPGLAIKLDEVTARLETVVKELMSRLNEIRDQNEGPSRRTATPPRSVKKAAKRPPVTKSTRKKAAGG